MANEPNYIDYSQISFQFHGWMVTELGLSGNELIIFMAINSFSQGQAGCFFGGLRFLEKITGASRSTVIRILNGFVENGLLLKEEEMTNKGKRTYYSVNPEYTTWGSVKMTPLAVSKCDPPSVKMKLGSVKMTPNNKIDNKYDNKEKDIDSVPSSISKEKKRFSGVNPSKEKVEAYIREKGFHVSADRIISYYTNSGDLDVWRFKDGSLVRDWKRCICTCERNYKPGKSDDKHDSEESNSYDYYAELTRKAREKDKERSKEYVEKYGKLFDSVQGA